MVKIKTNKQHFICKECGFEYEERDWAEKCQKWCKEHNSCNLEITKHSKKRIDVRKDA
jgi:transposase-like protein